MSPTRRDFLKYTGATSLLLASSDLVGQLIAQSPKGNPLTSTFKGLADIVLGEAKKAGCSYADVRFTRSVNTGMTRDGLFLIENGEITGPVQNFRWNMSPLVAFANISAVGKSVPIHTGEAYDGPGTALVPALRVEDFYMTSVSPAV